MQETSIPTPANMSRGLVSLWLPWAFTSVCVLIVVGQRMENLTFVVVIFRHGDRAPIHLYPNDPYKETIWPNGLQQLTKEGIRQQYELGRFLRRRYDHFLNSSYDRHEIYVRSTDYDRTLMSAQANLAGLYPPYGSQLWHPEIHWQPLPVHTVPYYQDRLLKFPAKDCPRYYELMKETSQQPEYQNKINSWKNFTERIANYTGYDGDKDISYWVWNVYDTLFCQKSHNFNLPTWATEEEMKTLEEIRRFNVMAHVEMHKTNEKARLTGGILVDAVLRNFSKVVHSSLPLKLVMYSAHDTTLIALQGALKVFNGLHPPYASCHIFEFYKESDSTHSVSMYYRNDSSRGPYELVLPGCTSPCPVHQFTKLTAAVIPQDWNKECQSQENNQNTDVTTLALSVTVGVLGLTLIGLLYWVWRKHILS